MLLSGITGGEMGWQSVIKGNKKGAKKRLLRYLRIMQGLRLRNPS
ncbi:hypothetical protein PRUB_a1207 [Pseudoalteromonas rubra]|uniref:Uncharacterized protein n=1 Tax=Pseudoalteromonas rubra TaxID=43658 RepID=A0A8T0C7K2_9GAMM|nr:hypothetical protein PRUB_a1207 [Pseudoalteromonas rubra]